MITFYRQNPDSRLANFIQGYWQMECYDQAQHLDLIPDGFPEIFIQINPRAELTLKKEKQVFSFSNFGMIGQMTQGARVKLSKGAKLLFIKLYPWTPHLLFKTPFFQFTNQICKFEFSYLENEFGQLAIHFSSLDSLEDDFPLLDAIFLKKLANQSLQHPFLPLAVKAIYSSDGTLDIDSLNRSIGSSRRYIEKIFKNNIGLSPKQYARLIRVKKASLLLQQSSHKGIISNIAFDLNYYDLSHFFKDFKAIVGLSPSDYLQQQTGFLLEGKNSYLRQWEYS